MEVAVGTKNIQRFEHTGSHGTVITAMRCDFAGGVEVTARRRAKMEHILADVGQAFGFHAMHIWPELDGFTGYDNVTIRFVRK